MKIIHVIPAYKPAYCYGGPTQSVSFLCENLVKNELQIEVLTTTANGKYELNVPRNTPVFINGVKTYYFRRISKDHSHFSPKLLFNLYQKADAKTTIIHIHSWWNLVSILSCIIAKLKKIPVVLSPRGMLSPYSFGTGNTTIKYLLHQHIGKELIRYCHLHCTSEQERRELLPIQQVQHISTIPNMIDTRPHIPLNNSNFDDASFKMIFLSRIDPKKGLEILFYALNLLDYKWTLTIAGDGLETYIKVLKELAGELRIADKINWTGPATNSNKYAMIAQHHLLVLFSHNENFANVILESLITGTPVAISEDVGLAKYVKANELGWVAPANHIKIASVLKAAHHNKAKRQNIKTIAPSLIKEHYNQVLLTQQYINLYQQIREKH
ncbi:XrtY-associated glycosyltransferase XYAG1 [Pedobacter sp. GR22-6]|uniref:XrtY-associated glycosyltransferase XYAG1 n=1 Tax=Pedobacter sp. GR22-6 TaxID=3127957 RepID=UPI00307F9051